MYVSYLESLQKKLDSGFFRLKKQLSVNKNRGILTENTVVKIKLLRDDIDYNDNVCYELKLYVVEKTEYPKLYCLSEPIYVTFASRSTYSGDYNEDFQWFDEWFEPIKECNNIEQKYIAVRDSVDKRQNISLLIIFVLALVITGILMLCDNKIPHVNVMFILNFAIMIAAAILICNCIDRAERSKCNKLSERFQTIISSAGVAGKE